VKYAVVNRSCCQGGEITRQGELKDFSPERYSCVELQTPQVTAALPLKRPSPGHFAVSFRTDRSSREKITLWVVVGSGTLPGGAYALPLKDSAELEKVR